MFNRPARRRTNTGPHLLIVALLVVIILVLLFGAAAIKGWIKSTVVGVAGFAAICAALIWLSSFFGENGFLYVMLAIPGLVVLIGIAGFVEERRAKLAEVERVRSQDNKFRKRKN